jgi:sugar lactone lactonase YvrE
VGWQQINRRLFNSYPTVSPTVTGYDPTTGAVSGTIGGADPDGDKLVYSASATKNGTVVIDQARGTFVYTPNQTVAHNQSTTGATPLFESITFTASDDAAVNGFHLHLLSATAPTQSSRTVSIPVMPVNGAPTATVTATTNADGTTTIAVTPRDPDGDTVVTSFTQPAHGTLTGGNGSYLYTPTPGYPHQVASGSVPGTDAVTFTFTDNHGGSSTVRVPLTIAPVNTAPTVTVSQVGETGADGSRVLTVATTDADGDPVTITVVTPPTHGKLEAVAGGYRYTPDATYAHGLAQNGGTTNGSDTIVFGYDDGHGARGTVTVQPVVTPQNKPVTGSASLISTVNNVTTWTYSSSDGDSDTVSVTVTGQGTHGMFQIVGGTLVYTPTDGVPHSLSADGKSITDQGTITFDDGHGSTYTSTVTATIVPVNADPTAAVQAGRDDAGRTTFTVIPSDTDQDTVTVTIGTALAHGTFSQVSPGVFLFTPDSTYAHGLTAQTVVEGSLRLDDGHGGIVFVPISATITPQNAAPTGTAAVTDRTTVWSGIVATAGSTRPAAVSADGRFFAFRGTTSVTIVDAATGTVLRSTPMPTVDIASGSPWPYTAMAFSPDGSRLYVQSPGIYSAVDTTTGAVVDTFTNPFENSTATTVSPDGKKLLFVANKTLVVLDTTTHAELNRVALSTAYDSLAVTPDGTRVVAFGAAPVFQIVDLTTNQTRTSPSTSVFRVVVSPDGSRIYYTTNSAGVTVLDAASLAQVGTVSALPMSRAIGISRDGTRLYGAGYDGALTTVDIATDTVLSTTGPTTRFPSDSVVETATGTVVFGTVTGAATSFTPVLLGRVNASDPDNDTLTYTVTTPAASGTVAVNPDGTFRYTPTAPGVLDSFVVTVDDGHGGKTAVPVSLFTGTTTQPQSVVSATTPAPNGGTSYTIGVGSTPVTVTSGTAPANGTVSVSGTTVVYTPDTGHPHAISTGGATSATDPFTIVVTLPSGSTTSVTLTPVVTAVNAKPTASVQTTPDGTSTTFRISPSDTDGDTVTSTVTTQPTHGTVTATSTGYTYTPFSAHAHQLAVGGSTVPGSDSFVITLDDGHGGRVPVTVTARIAPQNSDPRGAVASSPKGDGSTTYVVTTTDDDGDTVSIAVVTGPSHGTFTGAAGTYVYTPDATYRAGLTQAGSDSVTLAFTDGYGGRTTLVLTPTIPVVPTNSAPTVMVTHTAPDLTIDPNRFTFSAGANDILLSRDGTTLYVAEYALSRLTAIDVTSRQTVATYALGQGATWLAWSPDQRYIYSSNTDASLSVVDTVSGTVRRVAVDRYVDRLVAASDGRLVVAGFSGGILVIDPATGAVARTIDTPAPVSALAMSPDSRLIYTVDRFTPQFRTYDAQTGALVSATPLAGVSDEVVVSPDGRRAYVAQTMTNTITVVDLTTMSSVTTLAFGKQANGIELSPDGRILYVTSNSDRLVTALDATTMRTIDRYGITANAYPMAVSPDGRTLYVADQGGGAAFAYTWVDGGTIRATDPDGDVTSSTVTSAPSRGTVVLNADGTFTYRGTGASAANDAFTVTTSDGRGGVTTTVVSVPGAPGEAAASAVFDISRDQFGNTFYTLIDRSQTATLDASTATHGTLLGGNGSWVFQPDRTYLHTLSAGGNGLAGAEAVTATVVSGTGSSTTVTLNPALIPFNTAPVGYVERLTSSAAPGGIVYRVSIGSFDTEYDATSTSMSAAPLNGGYVRRISDTEYEYSVSTIVQQRFARGVTVRDDFIVVVDDGHGGRRLVTIPITFSGLGV